jgi:hypothetical protein
VWNFLPGRLYDKATNFLSSQRNYGCQLGRGDGGRGVGGYCITPCKDIFPIVQYAAALLCCRYHAGMLRHRLRLRSPAEAVRDSYWRVPANPGQDGGHVHQSQRLQVGPRRCNEDDNQYCSFGPLFLEKFFLSVPEFLPDAEFFRSDSDILAGSGISQLSD